MMSKVLINFFKTNLFEIFYFIYFCYLYYDLSYGLQSSTFFYTIFFLFILILPFVKKLSTFSFSLVDLVPISILVCACGGIITALYHQIEPYFILRNSVGLFMFIFYFIFSIYFKSEQLIKILKNISIMANLFILVSLLARNEFYFLGIGTQRFIYSPLLVFAFIIYPYLLNQFLDQLLFEKFSLSKLAFNLINIGIVFFNVYTISLSKGALLGILVISFLYLLLKIYHMGYITLNKTLLFSSLAYLTFILSLRLGILTQVFNKIFGNKDAGNQSRFLQNDYLFRETSFWGNGLGSYLLNGFYRDGNLKYSYESTFFNYWNKLGFFWFLILFSFLFSVFLLFKKRNLDSKSLICLGTFFYILISLGNPSLFGPSYVILACLGLILIRDDFYIRRKNPSESQ